MKWQTGCSFRFVGESLSGHLRSSAQIRRRNLSGLNPDFAARRLEQVINKALEKDRNLSLSARFPICAQDLQATKKAR